MRYACLTLLLVFAGPLTAADDFKVIKLEQDLHNLEQRVQDLSRQVEFLKQRVAIAGTQPLRRPRPAAAASAAATWLDAGNWQHVRPGMSEPDVISILGAPASIRTDEGARVLLYAMEVSSSGILSGRVTLRDGQVTEVAPPVLR